jgi:uncharacterized linocin/CFP29 family protein
MNPTMSPEAPATFAVMNRMQFAQGLGDSADRLINHGFDPGVLRPWIGSDGRSYIQKMVYNQRSGKLEPQVMVTNAPATLPRYAWELMDTTVLKAVRERLRFVADVRGAGLEYNLPNGMAHVMLSYQKTGDMTPATISMDPVRRGEGDRPDTDYATLPLPIIHKDFDFSAREILVSRNGNIPIDTSTADIAGRKVAEMAEQLAVGTAGTFTYGGGTIYGLINFPQRATKTDMPVPDGTNGPAVIAAILALRQMLIDDRHLGPYVFYVNSQWAQWLDTDFSATKGDNTLRQRILAIGDIQDIRTLDTLPTTQYQCALVEMQASNVRMVVGMEVQTIQWESLGGMMKHYKVMALIVPQFRPDTNNNSGVAHGRTA